MIEISFLPTAALFALLWLVLRAAVWLRQKHIDWRREAVLLLLYVNLAVILRVTFFPAARVNGRVRPLLFDAARMFPLRVNLLPFVALRHYRSRGELLLNLIGNIALFIPSGMLLPVVYQRLNSFGKVLAAGVGLSLGIELLQLPFYVRSTDVDDLILNTLGVAIGFGIRAAIRRFGKRRPEDNAIEERED